jgi:hypothetical protein
VAGTLERVRAQVVKRRQAQVDERFLPDIETVAPLLGEDELGLYLTGVT